MIEREGIYTTRAQDSSIYNTSTANNATNEAEAQTAENADQAGIGDYASSVAKLAANNPYQSGGEFASDQNQQLSNVSDAGTQALGTQLQDVATRTGQNPGAAIAATEAGAEANTRNLASEMASADASRIGSEAGYNANVTADTAKIPELENSLYGTASSAANGQENTALGAAGQNKSFGDTLGTSLASGLGSGLASLAVGKAGGSVPSGGGGGGTADPSAIASNAGNLPGQDVSMGDGEGDDAFI